MTAETSDFAVSLGYRRAYSLRKMMAGSTLVAARVGTSLLTETVLESFCWRFT